MQGGGTVRSHLETVKRMGHPVPELEVPPPPPALHFCLPFFFQLQRSRPYSNGTPLQIPASEYRAEIELHGIRLTRMDIGLLRLLDDTWLRCMREPAQV